MAAAGDSISVFYFYLYLSARYTIALLPLASITGDFLWIFLRNLST
jgi:hypothetical protein